MIWQFLICLVVPIGAVIVCRGTRYAFPLAVIAGVPIQVGRMLWLAIYTDFAEIDIIFHVAVVTWSGVLAAWYGMLCIAGGGVRYLMTRK